MKSIPKYETNIDSVSIKTNSITKQLNSEKLTDLINHLQNNPSETDIKKNKGNDLLEYFPNDFYIKKNKINDFLYEYKFYKSRQLLMSVESGVNGSRFGNTTYYLEFNFYGLKSYNDKNDIKSLSILKYIVSYFFDKQITFQLSELDVAIDVSNIKSNQLFVMRKAITFKNKINPLKPYINYKDNYAVTDTYYIEKKNNDMRGYIYNKTKKEYEVRNNIMMDEIVRFEVKLQKRLRNNYSVEFISKQLNMYQVYFFSTEKECKNHKKMYIKNNLIMDYKLRTALTRVHKLSFDVSVIDNFIKDVLTNNRTDKEEALLPTILDFM